MIICILGIVVMQFVFDKVEIVSSIHLKADSLFNMMDSLVTARTVYNTAWQ